MNDTERLIHLRRAVREIDLVADHLTNRVRYCTSCSDAELVDPNRSRAEFDLRTARSLVVGAATALGLDLEARPRRMPRSRGRSLHLVRPR